MFYSFVEFEALGISLAYAITLIAMVCNFAGPGLSLVARRICKGIFSAMCFSVLLTKVDNLVCRASV